MVSSRPIVAPEITMDERPCMSRIVPVNVISSPGDALILDTISSLTGSEATSTMDVNVSVLPERFSAVITTSLIFEGASSGIVNL